MKPKGRILTLTTDLGTGDGYVGAVKGAVLSLAPSAAIHDISHDIAPHDIWGGAWCLRRTMPHFPTGTVHLVVVDPGVGSARAGVVIETQRYLLVGPDNGVLSLAARDEGIRRVIEISEEGEHWRKSRTFDGLTLFAPVAGHLLSGMALDDVGTEAEDLVELPERITKAHGNVIDGAVMLFDRFGNAITDIPGSAMEGRKVVSISLKNTHQARFCDHYGELAGQTAIGGVVNSDGFLELALYGQSLRDHLELESGDPVRVLLKPM